MRTPSSTRSPFSLARPTVAASPSLLRPLSLFARLTTPLRCRSAPLSPRHEVLSHARCAGDGVLLLASSSSTAAGIYQSQRVVGRRVAPSPPWRSRDFAAKDAPDLTPKGRPSPLAWMWWIHGMEAPEPGSVFRRSSSALSLLLVPPLRPVDVASSLHAS